MRRYTSESAWERLSLSEGLCVCLIDCVCCWKVGVFEQTRLGVYYIHPVCEHVNVGDNGIDIRVCMRRQICIIIMCALM